MCQRISGTVSERAQARTCITVSVSADSTRNRVKGKASAQGMNGDGVEPVLCAFVAVNEVNSNFTWAWLEYSRQALDREEFRQYTVNENESQNKTSCRARRIKVCGCCCERYGREQ